MLLVTLTFSHTYMAKHKGSKKHKPRKCVEME